MLIDDLFHQEITVTGAEEDLSFYIAIPLPPPPPLSSLSSSSSGTHNVTILLVISYTPSIVGAPTNDSVPSLQQQQQQQGICSINGICYLHCFIVL